MPGPTPKNPRTRQRRNKTSTAARLMPESSRRKRLPVKLPDRTATEFVDGEPQEEIVPWHPFVLDWWKALRGSPVAALLLSVDIPRLYILADLWDSYWKGDRSLAAEIRLQSQCFGLTPIDRRRLGWEIDEDPTPRRAAPTRSGDSGNRTGQPAANNDPRDLRLRVLA